MFSPIFISRVIQNRKFPVNNYQHDLCPFLFSSLRRKEKRWENLHSALLGIIESVHKLFDEQLRERWKFSSQMCISSFSSSVPAAIKNVRIQFICPFYQKEKEFDNMIHLIMSNVLWQLLMLTRSHQLSLSLSLLLSINIFMQREREEKSETPWRSILLRVHTEHRRREQRAKKKKKKRKERKKEKKKYTKTGQLWQIISQSDVPTHTTCWQKRSPIVISESRATAVLITMFDIDNDLWVSQIDRWKQKGTKEHTHVRILYGYIDVSALIGKIKLKNANLICHLLTLETTWRSIFHHYFSR